MKKNVRKEGELENLPVPVINSDTGNVGSAASQEELTRQEDGNDATDE